ncbi:class I SAM-dependent methyltransferase [Brooklawnia cerclae]|uniref:SAM-dependent methyltransferase n=1 Tax=Brooklawnia cerclae TaxID=349934 RepID=A0ABX0SI63_9ACTN|nr:class I SAM-dependent methyltransferase [Brooklawnia cerclae]NIH56422.1 SAM-dependent methyltransferase [Brooklawnia cerclae]
MQERANDTATGGPEDTPPNDAGQAGNDDHGHADGNQAGWPEIAPVDYWEDRYSGSGPVWSGRVNRVLADIAGALPPGRALDLGCGEGGDVIWLAQHGWTATGLDISPTAIARAAEAAREAGIPGNRAQFLATDLSEPGGLGDYDLVTASFLHSPVGLPRTEILRRAAGHVAPGGHLLVTSHAAAPPWASALHEKEHRFPTPREEAEALALDEREWQVLVCEVRQRLATGPDGEPATLSDGVVLARRYPDATRGDA